VVTVSVAICVDFACGLSVRKSYRAGRHFRVFPRIFVSRLTGRSNHALWGEHLLSHKYEGVEDFGKRDDLFFDRSKRWVVVVDDEEAIRKAVGSYLFDQGYQVTACADVDTALKVCLSHFSDESSSLSIPDCIVSDIRMPGKDGLEFLSIIRSEERLIEVPVILLTAKGMTKDRVAGFKAGADAYLPKPFDPEELLSIVDNLIARHRALSGDSVKVDDLKNDLDEIKYLLLERGGGGVGGGWVEATSVFLTPDERDVLVLLCKGSMNREIADELFTSTRRVEQHLTSMFRKTKCSNRTELVRWAVSTGHVEI